MIILTPASETKSFNAITRSQVCASVPVLPGKLIVVDQDTNTSYNIPTTDYTHSYNCTTGWYESFNSITFPNDAAGNFIFREGTFYTLRIRDSLDSYDIYRDIIFCTGQNLPIYSIQTTGNNPTEEAYKKNETTNEYIVL